MLKPLILGCAISFAALCTTSYALEPTWISGTPELGFAAGDRVTATGVPNSLDNPGESSSFPSWVDAEGNLWLYQIPGDMWRYTPATNTWTRMSTVGGPQTSAGGFGALTQATWYGADGGLWMIDFVHIWRYDTQANTWGLMGEFSVNLTDDSPGHREEPITWTDQNNNVYLFGGRYVPQNSYFYDMWKYDTSAGTWTFLSGGMPPTSGSSNQYVYGTRGMFHPDNHPSGDRFSNFDVNWVDSTGNLWYYNDDVLWQYDVTLKQWAYMSGTVAFGGDPVFGSQGIPDLANSPGSFESSSPLTWLGPDGNLWMFSVALWKYDISAGGWAWMGGPQSATNFQSRFAAAGVADPENWPAYGSAGTAWVDPSGKLYFHGASGRSDTWSYDTSAGLWTYWKGSVGSALLDSNTPGSKVWGTEWADDSGNLWLFSPAGERALWKFDTSVRQWSKKTYPDWSPVFSPLGAESFDAYPGARENAVTWEAPDGYVWMFGGYGHAADGSGRLSDLWRFNPKTEKWAWMGGSQNRNVDSVTTSPTGDNTPGGRTRAATWVDASGDLWLFGGRYWDYAPNWWPAPTIHYYLNDLWRFDVETLQWHLVQPDTGRLLVLPSFFQHGYFGDVGDYGSLGVADPGNRPGSRADAVVWTDPQGNLWMFGGDGYSAKEGEDPTAFPAKLNDVWKFDVATGLWTWMNGSKGDNAADIYGAPDVFDPANMPGGRDRAAAWMHDGKLRLYGGSGAHNSLSFLNAIWTFDTEMNSWAWTSNSLQPIPFASYGTMGIPSESNFPGIRYDAYAWAASDGSLWLYGGDGYAQWGRGLLDDMWLIKESTTPGNGADLAAAWAPAEAKCKTNNKGITKCKLKASLFVTNTGNEQAAKSITRFYLSDDQVLGAGDVELKGKKLGKLKPGKSKNAKVKLKIDAPATGKFLIAVLDADGAVAETDELNNTVVSPPLP